MKYLGYSNIQYGMYLIFYWAYTVPDKKAEDAILFLCLLCDMYIMCGGTGYLVVVDLLPACVSL